MSEIENLWPTLSEAHGVAEKPSPKDEPSDWEIVAEDDTFDPDVEVVVVRPNPKVLRHCASSPDLRFLTTSFPPLVEEDRSDEDSSSHVLVSGPASVVSVSSETIKRVPSFRDAILVQNESKEANEEEAPKEITPIKKSQKKIKPRIVVRPIKRCAKSTGDLKSLAEEEEILGETDADEYYNRKAAGYSGRKNGQKERPDEAKRRNIIMYKKDLQRQKQAGRG